MNRNKPYIYLALTFLISYLSWGILMFNSGMKFGEPLFMVLYLLGGFGPTISAIIINLMDKKENKKTFFKSIVDVKLGFWYLIIFLPVIASALVTYGINMLINPSGISGLKIMDWYMFFPLMAAMVIGGGLEELGWRGTLLPELNKIFGFLTSTLIIWIIWTAWHLPLFFIKGVSQYQSSIPMFAINVLILTVFLNWFYNNTKNIFACVMFHAAINAMLGMGFIYGKDFNTGNIIELCVRTSVFFITIVIVNYFNKQTIKTK